MSNQLPFLLFLSFHTFAYFSFPLKHYKLIINQAKPVSAPLFLLQYCSAISLDAQYLIGFSFCHCLWDLTKRRVADMEVDKVTDKVVDIMANKKLADMELDMVANMD